MGIEPPGATRPSRTACRDGARPLKRICYPRCSRGAAKAFGRGMRASGRLRGIRHALPGGGPLDAGTLVDSLMDVEASRVLEEPQAIPKPPAPSASQLTTLTLPLRG